MPSRKVWNQCKDVLKEKLNQHNFSSWIDPVDCISFRGNSMTLSVPSNFFIEWINEHYRKSIEEIAGDLFGSEVTLKFIVSDNGNGKTKAPAISVNAKRKSLVAQAKVRANLNEKYTFDNFVVGKSNEFCNASCRAVANKIGQTYNPLFVYGGVGLGKTHLMQAIGNAVLEKKPELNVLYLSSEKFVNSMINSLQRGAMVSFRKKYRNLDVLMVDDIQFIGGKERTQEEFFHTFNTLYEMKKQIVISSDRFPKDIKNLEERLRSRFEWGLISDIQSPELEIKIAILKKLSKQNGFDLDEEVATFLAKKIKSNIRELEGCLARVMAYASLIGGGINIDMARETLKGIYDDTAKTVDIRQIQKAVCELYGIKVSEMKSKNRSKNIALPRHVAAYLCREFTNTSLPEIGKSFGGRDHTTIMHSVAKIKKEIEINTKLYNRINEIKRALDL
ncbi:Chromosomal replication initiator protein DnaA [hydrothermal vent metagenome]|uniref:Chromosomal replication initiator protein DnaA n=1 Tax=hydrothermal vent metagenome TaxID=652676 RepID=A0A3B1BMA6_9ZZZZ